MAACSYHHSVILCSDGSIFSCGRNDSGQLGHGDTVDKKIPHPVSSAPRNITSVSCGQFHTVVSTASGLVFVSGKNDYGQLGLENTTNVKVLTKINVPAEMDNIVQVCCGYYHTLLLSSTGIVGGFGRNDYGQLGMGHAQPKIFLCTIVTGLRDKGVTLLAAGCYHSIGVTMNGMLYVFGRNNHGQLATGDLEERHNPHPIDDFIGQKVIAVSAGFYHTLVLTTEGQALLGEGALGLNTLNSESLADHTEVDVKQLATGFKKDLELLCGYEHLEKGGDYPSNSNSSNNGIKRPSFEHLSAISCRELITVIIRHITIFEQKDLMVITLDGKKAISNSIQSITSLLYILWEIMSDPGSFRINLPLSIADAQLLLKKLFPCLSKFLLTNKLGILEILQEEKTSKLESKTENEEREEEDDLEIALENIEMNYHNAHQTGNHASNVIIDHVARIRDYIESLFTATLENGQQTRLSCTLQKLRVILLQIYFDPKLLLHFNEDDHLSISIADVILSNHEIFFQQPSIYLSLLKYIYHSIMSKNDSVIDGKLHGLYLRLLSCMGKVYHNIDEAIKMFQKSKNCSLQIFHVFLTIYNFYSRYTIEKAISTGSSTLTNGPTSLNQGAPNRLLSGGNGLNSSSIDIRRVLTVLEQSVNNLIKCGIPLILTYQPQLLAEGIIDTEEIFINMIQESEKVIDYALLSQQSFSEETLSQLRYNTQMPSILPSTFLFSIGAAKKGMFMMKLFPYLLSFIQKLQLITKYEIQNYQQKAVAGNERRNSSDNLNHLVGAAANKQKEGEVAAPALALAHPAVITSYNSTREEDTSESLAEELLYLKKDQSQISWWFRLLKMTVNLLCRMKLGHLNRLNAHSSMLDPKFHLDDTQVPVPSSISHHRVWYFLDLYEEYLVQWQEMAISPKLSDRTLEICKFCRAGEKSTDNVYKMLSISTQANFSGALLKQVEEVLVEMILHIAYPKISLDLIPAKYYSSIFHLATSVTKFFHSKRSQLVSNSESLSWVEVLSSLTDLATEFSVMMQKNKLTTGFLPLPVVQIKTERAKKNWRRALLYVVTYVRWKTAVKLRYSTLPLLLVDFISQSIGYITKDFTCIPMVANELGVKAVGIKVNVRAVYGALLDENQRHTFVNDELSAAVSLLDSIDPLSLKSDVVIGLLASFRDKRRVMSVVEPMRVIISTPCSLANAELMKRNVRDIEISMMKIIEAPLLSDSSFHFTMIELQLLSNAIRFLQVLYSSSRIRYNFYRHHSSYLFSLTTASRLLLLLYEKYRNWLTIGEEKLFAKKLGNIRERNIITKRTIFILLSFIQEMVMIHLNHDGGNNRHHNENNLAFILREILPSYNQILNRLQLIRNEETFNNPDETTAASVTANHSASASASSLSLVNLSSNLHPANPVLIHSGNNSGKEENNGQSIVGATLTPSSSASLLPSPITNAILTTTNSGNRLVNAAGTSSHNIAATPASAVNAAKKRCQDLIIKPLEFSRNSEGIVIQGEKLLNNCKGVDFSIVTWILLTNKSSSSSNTAASITNNSKGNFIIGKIHHNEAWPLILLKSDHKLEVIYGHNNEYEKGTTENSIPLHTWTHVAVVVDQKKIKIFINGVLDLQITTAKANNKAIVYPLVIGSCPANVRTRVNYVKEGFDGMLAQCKYYSRALSPIHVKVIFDQGPPETTDISAKIIFHVLASLKYIINTVNVSSVHEELKISSELCHFIFMTDSNRRNRCAALQLLTNILQLNVLSDMNLTHLQGLSLIQSAYSVSSVSVKAIPFSSPVVQADNFSFEERIIWYFIRVAGCNWMQGNIIEHTLMMNNASSQQRSEEEQNYHHSNSSTMLFDFIPFLPRSCFNKSIADLLQGNSHANSNANSSTLLNNTASKVLASQFPERICSQEDPVGEITYQSIAVLYALSQDSKWKAAISSFLNKFFAQILDVIRTSNVQIMNSLMMIDLVGTAMLLGGVANGAYLGAQVTNFFDDVSGFIIQINNTVNGATLLSNPGKMKATDGLKMMKVRLNDLHFRDDHIVVSMNDVIVEASSSMMYLLEHYHNFVNLLSKDYLSYYIPESSFQTKSLLKCLRPIESLLFMKFLNAFMHIPVSVAQRLILSHKSQGSSLERLINDFLLSSIPYHMPVLEPINDFSLGNTSPLVSHWFMNMKYISSLPMKYIITQKFPMESEEAYLFDFMHKQIGLNYDTDVRKEFSQHGLLSRILISATSSQNSESSGIVAGASSSVTHFAMNDVFMKSIQYLEMTLSDKELTNAFFYYHYIRKQLIGFIRHLSTSSDPSKFAIAKSNVKSTQDEFLQQIVNLPTQNFSENRQLQMKLLSLLGLNSPIGSHSEGWAFVTTLKQLFTNTVAKQPILSSWQIVTQSILTTSNQETSAKLVMTMLVHAIKYACNSLLQHRHQKSVENILLSTDLYDRFLCNLYYWLEIDHTYSTLIFEQTVTLILNEFLPLLPMDEIEVVEFKILQLICYVLKRFSTKLLQGQVKLSKDLLEMVKGTVFSELRSRAQEHLLKYKGHNMNDVSYYAYHITQLVTAMELVQRRATIEHSNLLSQFKALPSSPNLPQVPSGSSKQSVPSNGIAAKLQAMEVGSPKLITVRSHSIDVDLSPCVQSVLSFATAEVLQTLSLPSSVLDNIIIEVALGISGGMLGNNTTEFIYETIFCGSSTRLVQSGLMPDSVYMIKCRAYLTSQLVLPFSWSSSVEFRTEKGLLFTFDSLKSGADIILSEDSLTASYTGDDAWSSLLSTRSFSSGTTSWEVRINQSSTAYIFIGVATSAADLNTFLGGCSNGWGFIGEQALYHNREKVKVYGETFTTGDVIGVTLDLNLGTLSFTKNKKSLGIAFDKIYGDLYPAVAFYNIGQELQILPDSFKTTCSHEPIPISPARLNFDELSLMNELILCLYSRTSLSPRIALMVAEHCNQWCSNQGYVRARTVSKRDIFLSVESPLLKRFSLVVGERVRTFYGVAEVAGTAYNRVWFKVNSAEEVWFFSNQQIIEGRAKKLFMRCTYNTNDITAASSAPIGSPNSSNNAANGANNSLYSITFDSSSIMELLDPQKWSKEMDEALIDFLFRQSDISGVEPWKITSDKLFDQYRSLQQQLTRIILATNTADSNTTTTTEESALLAHKWGISGPKRKAVIARLGLIRILNQYMDMYLPFFISDYYRSNFDENQLPSTDEFVPIIETITQNYRLSDENNFSPSSTRRLEKQRYYWSPTSYRWDERSEKIARIQELAFGPLHSLRHLIFRSLKFQHFQEVIRRTSTRPAKTEDDYDYPENLPHVKINRLKALRAREAAELLGLSGDDVLLNTMFCQLWKELKINTSEKLRISYTHPMDDGQSRSFKIKFEGEGVDDYGGPYREIFQQICNELQLLHPSSQSTHYHNHHQESDLSSLSSTTAMIQPGSSLASASITENPDRPSVHVDAFEEIHSDAAIASFLPKDSKGAHSPLPEVVTNNKLNCFFPLFLPTPNWTNEAECSEKYRYMFHPAATSHLKQELFYFMGQLVGIAIRSRITLDLALPSFIWKSVVGESLTEKDLASFDQSAYDLILQLQALQQAFIGRGRKKEALSEEENEMIRDLTWTATRSDGEIIELKEDGKNVAVEIDDLGEYLTAYLDVRMTENQTAIQLFRSGLLTIIPESAITLLTWQELQSMVCGSNSIDIQRLKDNTEYDDDVSPDDTHIISFWEVLQEFNEIEKSAFLKFVWARPSLPPKDVEFTQKMRILSAATDDNNTLKQDQFLPKAHTCFFSINLPKYSSKKVSTTNTVYYYIINSNLFYSSFYRF